MFYGPIKRKSTTIVSLLADGEARTSARHFFFWNAAKHTGETRRRASVELPRWPIKLRLSVEVYANRNLLDERPERSSMFFAPHSMCTYYRVKS